MSNNYLASGRRELAQRIMAVAMSFVMVTSSIPAVPVYADEAIDTQSVIESVESENFQVEDEAVGTSEEVSDEPQTGEEPSSGYSAESQSNTAENIDSNGSDEEATLDSDTNSSDITSNDQNANQVESSVMESPADGSSVGEAGESSSNSGDSQQDTEAVQATPETTYVFVDGDSGVKVIVTTTGESLKSKLAAATLNVKSSLTHNLDEATISYMGGLLKDVFQGDVDFDSYEIQLSSNGAELDVRAIEGTTISVEIPNSVTDAELYTTDDANELSKVQNISWSDGKSIANVNRLGVFAVSRGLVQMSDEASGKTTIDAYEADNTSYNAVANLKAMGLCVNAAKGADEGKPMASDRTAPNAVAEAGDHEVVLTVPLEAKVAVGEAGLSGCDGATAEVSADGSSLVFHLTERADSYEFSATGLTWMGMELGAATLTVDLSASGIDLDSVFAEPEPAYNAVANLKAMGLCVNAAKGADEGKPMASDRTAPNAVAEAGDHEVVLTVPLEAKVAVGEAGLSGCDGATAEVSADGSSLVFHLTERADSYEFSATGLTWMGMELGAATLTVDLSASGIDLDSVFAKADPNAPCSSVAGLNPGVYKVSGNLYVIDDDGQVHFLNSTRDGNVAAGDSPILDDARLMVTENGDITLGVWTDQSYTFDSLGSADGASYEFRDGKEGFYQENAHPYISFTLDGLSGKWDFMGASVSKDGKAYSEVYLRVDFANVSTWLDNNEAPASGCGKIDPGTYEVTANLYVPGTYNPKLIGVNAFMTSDALPPTTPVYGNATLTVADDGSMTLDVDIPCWMFTLKKVSNGVGGIRVLEGELDNETYGSTDSGYTTVGRITHFKFALDDTSTGFYYFTDCEEYPLPFGETWTLPMYLKVDLANAHVHEEPVEEEIQKTLTDESSSVSVFLSTKNKELGALLDGATLVATRYVAGDAVYDQVRSKLAQTFTNWTNGVPSAVFTMAVKAADDSDIDVSEFDSVVWALTDTDAIFNPPSVSRFNLSSNGFCYEFDNGNLERVTGASVVYGNDYGFPSRSYVWEDASARTFVIVSSIDYDTGSKAYVPFTFELDEALSGVSGSFDARDGANANFNSSDYDKVTLKVESDTEGDRSKLARGAIAAADGMPYEDASVSSFAATCIRNSNGAMWYLTSAVMKDFAQAVGSYSFPAAYDQSQLYFINVDANGNATASLAADTYPFNGVAVENGKITVSWSMYREAGDQKNKADEVFKALYRGVTGDANGEGYAYFAVVSNTAADKVAAEPAVATGLVYTAAEQTGVKVDTGYTLMGDTAAVNAGEYTATAKLESGYTWADGTKDDKTITWSIAPATLTAKYTDEQVTEGTEPTYAISVTGFVGDEDITSIEGYESPTIPDDVKPSKIAEGSYTLTPAGGKAGKNYQFRYVSGKLVVTKAPEGLAPGTYSITANVIVRGEDNLYIPGLTAYITNPVVPPTEPVSENATLVVKSDGTHVLYVPMPNGTFTVRSAQTTDTSKFDVIGSTVNDVVYEGKGETREGRITGLYFELKDFGGTYVMDKCAEFPTLLGQDWDVPLTLSVDFSSAQKVSDGTTVNVPSYVEPGQKTDPTPDPTPDPGTSVEAPAANIGLVYNGKTQTGVAASKAYKLTGATAKDAGTYTATATLNEGYEWADGTTAPKSVTYTIAKAKLTATYAGETVVEGAEPAYAVDVTGFVNGETVLTAAGFKAPSVEKVASGQLVAGKSFTLTPAGGEADNYTYMYVAGTLKVTEPAGTIAPGTYQITANLYVPGELNTVLGKNAYLTNASTPITDGNAPLTPVSDNAKLVVRADGSRVLVIPVVNPVFTLQSVASGENVKVLGTERGGEVVGSTQVSDRVTMLYVELGDDSGSYQLGDCVEFPTLLNQEWNVPLRISADFSSLVKLSSTATITIPGQNGTDKPDNGNTGGNGTNNGGTTTPDNGNGSNNNGNANQGNNGTVDNNGGQNGNQGTAGNVNNSDGSYRLSAGTYTVTANIWLSDRSATGLPLMPYLTSGDFPPMYPVTGNATLTVDESGHATLRVPITIQSKVMTVSGISGLSVVDTEYSGGYVSAVTIDLGTITDMSGVITRSCSATIVMGSLASTISGITGSHTWPATFQVVFTGVPVSGNAGSSYDWSKAAAAAGNGTLAAGVGALAAEGTGAAADLDFLATATKAASQMAVHGAAGELETGTAEGTSADFACAGVSNTLTALDPDVALGTDATAALALAAALTGGELELASGAENFEAAFLGGKAA